LYENKKYIVKFFTNLFVKNLQETLFLFVDLFQR
jgi:hypothetical protein